MDECKYLLYHKLLAKLIGLWSCDRTALMANLLAILVT